MVSAKQSAFADAGSHHRQMVEILRLTYHRQMVEGLRLTYHRQMVEGLR